MFWVKSLSAYVSSVGSQTNQPKKKHFLGSSDSLFPFSIFAAAFVSLVQAAYNNFVFPAKEIDAKLRKAVHVIFLIFYHIILSRSIFLIFRKPKMNLKQKYFWLFF